MRRALSLEWKLPLLMTALSAAGLLAFLAFTYVTLARGAERVVRDRFVHASRQVARTVEDALLARMAAMRGAASDSAVVHVALSARDRRSVSTADRASARKALERLLVARDSLPVTLLDSRGRAILAVGSARPPYIAPVDPASVAPAGTGALDSVRFSRVMQVRDRMAFWAVAPVVADGERVGFISHLRWVTGRRDALETLREFTREDLTLYMRNADGTGWMFAPRLARRSADRA